MKKNIKSVLAKSLVVAMALSVAGVAPGSDAAAASKKPGLAKKASVTVGKKKTIKVTGKAKVKKTAWSLTKAGKKIVSLSAKKAKSVTVKGKKAGKATLTAKITVAKVKKPYTKKCTVTVNPAKSTTTPTPVPTTASTPKPTAGGNIMPNGYEITETYSIPVTELNETALTSEIKRDSKAIVDEKEWLPGGGVSFIAQGDDNSGVSFYVNPCTNENQLDDLDSGFQGYHPDQTKDMSDYDYIRLQLVTDDEVNLRTYDSFDNIEAGPFPGQVATESYEGNKVTECVGPAEGYLYRDGDRHGMTAKEEYVDRTVYFPISNLVTGTGLENGNGCDMKDIVAVAVSPQDGGSVITLKAIDFVRVKRTTLVSSIKIEADKTVIANRRDTQLRAVVNADATRPIVKWTSSDESIAKVNAQGLVTADKTKKGDVTITATSTDGSNVSATIKITVGEVKEDISTQTLDLTSEKVLVNSNSTKSAAGINFGKGKGNGFVNFKGVIDEKNMPLSQYKTITVTWKIVDAEGKDVSSFSAKPDYGKVCFVKDGLLNGTNSGPYPVSIVEFTGETTEMDIADYADTKDEPNPDQIAGFNLQIGGDGYEFPADYAIVITEVKFIAK